MTQKTTEDDVTRAMKIMHGMQPPHRGFIIDLVQHPEWLGLRVYKPNIEQFSEPQKLDLAQHLYLMEQTINSTGVRCIIEGVENDPPSRASILSGRGRQPLG